MVDISPTYHLSDLLLKQGWSLEARLLFAMFEFVDIQTKYMISNFEIVLKDFSWAEISSVY